MVKTKAMIEVFKTNVENAFQANTIKDQIQKTFVDYTANFDLDDCDRILRVKGTDFVHATPVIELLKDFGVNAEVLPDVVPESSFHDETL